MVGLAGITGQSRLRWLDSAVLIGALEAGVGYSALCWLIFQFECSQVGSRINLIPTRYHARMFVAGS
jgi:hypothetical protein